MTADYIMSPPGLRFHIHYVSIYLFHSICCQRCDDVISSQSWLRPALASMELSQMIVQGQWDKDSVLLQIPHFNEEIIQRCSSHKPPVETVFDVIELEPDDRDSLLNLSPEKMSDVALFCNSYPNIELSYQSSFEGAEVESGDTISVTVILQRELSDEDIDPSLIGKVISSSKWGKFSAF